jgi:hypothetical protein
VRAESTEGEFVSDEPPRGTLDFGESGLCEVVAELGAGVEHEVEFVKECVEVKLGDAVKADEFAVDVVDDFVFGLGFGEENGEAAAEDLGVEGMRGDAGEDVFEQARFPPWPAYDWARFGDERKVGFVVVEHVRGFRF